LAQATYKEIGDDLGLSVQSIRQIHAKSLRKLRRHARRYYPAKPIEENLARERAFGAGRQSKKSRPRPADKILVSPGSDAALSKYPPGKRAYCAVDHLPARPQVRVPGTTHAESRRTKGHGRDAFAGHRMFACRTRY